jgi:hypothetical protein
MVSCNVYRCIRKVILGGNMKEEKILNIKITIIAVICIVLLMIAIVPKGLQNDTFYTLKLGKLILDNGIDMKEHFAWHEGLPYTYPHWLYDIGMYLVYEIGGFNGVYISSIVLGAILGIVMFLTNTRITKNSVLSFLTVTLMLYIGQDFITARAQLVTFILFVLEIFCIEKFLENRKISYTIILLVIPIIIANVHAAVFPFYFVLYLPYIGEYIVSLLVKSNLITKFLLKTDEIELKSLKKKKNINENIQKKIDILTKRIEVNKDRIEERKNKKTEPYKIIVEKNNNVINLIGLMFVAAFTGLLTPIGDTPYTYLYHTMKGNTTNNISEHLPIVLYNSKLVLAFLAISISIGCFTKVKIKLSDLFLFCGLTFLTIMSRRQESLLLFIGILPVNKMISQLIESYDPNEMKAILKAFTSIIGKIIIYGLFVLFMIIQIKKTSNDEIVSPKSYPLEAVNYIKNNLDVKQIKLFNEYNFGSYLLYNDIPVFIDSRADVYDPQFNKKEDDIFRDFINISDVCTDYEEKFEHYGITHLLIYKNSTLSKVLKNKSNYEELYSDDNFIIYKKLS